MSKDRQPIRGQGDAERVIEKGHGGTQHRVYGFDLTDTVEGLVSRGIPKATIAAGELDFVPEASDPTRTARELSALWGDAKAARERRQGRPGRSHLPKHHRTS